GFSADLPSGSNRVSIAMTYPGFGSTSSVTLTGFNGGGDIIAQQSGPSNAPDPFSLEINSAQFDITRLQVQVPMGFFAAYDNISFTIVPEPVESTVFFVLLLPIRRRR